MIANKEPGQEKVLKFFSFRTRSSTWRKPWVWPVGARKELALGISNEGNARTLAHVPVTDTDFEIGAIQEKGTGHDLNAHFHAHVPLGRP